MNIYKQLEKHSSFLWRPLTDWKIFLEWNINCFDDINILFDWEDSDNYVFLQVKWQKESNNPDFLLNDKIYHAISNYINNQNNLTDRKNSRLIIVCSKQVNRLIKKMLSWNWTDSKVREEKMIFFLRKRFPKCSVIMWQKIINVLFWRKLYKVDAEMLDYMSRINESLKNVKIIESVNREDLEKELYTIIDKHELQDLVLRVQDLSVNITPINSSESEFEIYKNYLYTQFKPWKTIIDLEMIESPKALY